MSHTVKLKSQLTCLESIKRACDRMGNVKLQGKGKTSFYSEKDISGLKIKLDGWKYPIVINTETGDIAFDNYGGRWGKQTELDKFKQAYGVEKAKLEGTRCNYEVTEEQLSTGEIKVTLNVGGKATLEAADGDPMAGGYGIADASE